MKRVYAVIKDLICCGYQINFNSFIKGYNRRALPALIICALMLSALGSARAQNAVTGQTVKTATAYSPAKEGTYQFILNSRRGDREITLSTQQLLVIEKLRKDDEVVCAQSTYSDDIKVKILPRNIINSPNFKPVPLKYFKDEESYEEHHNFRYVEFQ